MNTLSDKELKKLFHQQKTEIADDGFTKNVMKHIPHTHKYNRWITGICTFAGIFIFVVSGGYFELIKLIFSFLSYVVNIKIPSSGELICIYLLILAGIGIGSSFFVKAMEYDYD